MASFVFNGQKAFQDVNWETDDLRSMLVTAAPDPDADFLNDASIVELTTTTTTTYTRVNVTGAAVVTDDTNNRQTLNADDRNHGALAAGETVFGEIIYKHVTDDTDSIPVAYNEIDIDDRATTGYDFVLANLTNPNEVIRIS